MGSCSVHQRLLTTAKSAGNTTYRRRAEVLERRCLAGDSCEVIRYFLLHRGQRHRRGASEQVVCAQLVNNAVGARRAQGLKAHALTQVAVGAPLAGHRARRALR
jgi:hypothetical protein